MFCIRHIPLIFVLLDAISCEVLLRLSPNDEKKEIISELLNRQGDLPIDFWRLPDEMDKSADLMVSDAYLPILKRFLRKSGVDYKVTVDDLKTLVQQERQSIETGRRKRAASNFDFHNYQSLEEMEAHLIRLSAWYPKIAHLQTIATTHENRSVYMIKIGTPSNRRKPAIWIDGGIHAREWVSPHVAMYFAHDLTVNYGHSPEITKLVDQLDWYIVPNLNPDGYVFSWENTDPYNRFWRKNRSNNPCAWWFRKWRCCAGVDLNRNFDANWNVALDSGKSPCDTLYRGERAFSQPETKAVKDFIIPRKHLFKAFVSLHTYAQMWIYSFGYARNHYPKDVTHLKYVAQQATKALASQYGTTYRIGSLPDLLYLASGTSKDWAKEIGVKYSYTLELRPGNASYFTGGFMLDRNQLFPTASETWQGIKVVGNTVINEFAHKV